MHIIVSEYIHKINSMSNHQWNKKPDFTTICKSTRLHQARELVKSKEAIVHGLLVKRYMNMNSRNQLNLNLRAAVN
jgi:hypothetical protein